MKKIIFFILIISFSSCHKQKKQIEYIAKVGDSYLTETKLLSMIPKYDMNNPIHKTYINSVISNWITKEVIYQKARDYHFEKDKSLLQKRDIFFRDLVIDSYLKYHFQTKISITEKMIKEYYLENRKSFIRNFNEAKISHLLVKEYEEAKRIRSVLLSRNAKLKEDLYNKYTFETKIVKQGQSLEEIDKTIFETKPRRVLGPIMSNYGFHLIYIYKRYTKGSYRPIEEVRDEIIQRLTQKYIQENYLIFSDSLKSISNYEIDEDILFKFMNEKCYIKMIE